MEDIKAHTTSEKIALLHHWIEQCPKHKMVFLGGAGVSTESGIPDFRSSKGIFNQDYPYPPEVLVSHSFFTDHPDAFYDFYCEKMIFLNAKPNKAHIKLAELEQRGILSAVITQNIDGLHQAAGSRQVLELHGSVLRNYCMSCGRFFSVEKLLELRKHAVDGIPRCSCCGIIKPDVVLYEESLDQDILLNSIRAIQNADLLLIAGTSLSVYPAASLMDYFTGSHLVIVNMAPTNRDRLADLCIEAKIGEVLDFS